EPRSPDSCATVSPRYSVSTAPLDVRNLSVSSATAVTFSALAMSLLSLCRPWCGFLPKNDERPGAQAHGAASLNGPANEDQGGTSSHAHLRGMSVSGTFGRTLPP